MATATITAPLSEDEEAILQDACSRATDWIKKGEKALSQQILQTALGGVEFRMEMRLEREAREAAAEG